MRSVRLRRKSSSKATSATRGSAVGSCGEGRKGKAACPNRQSAGIAPKPTGSGAKRLRLLPHAKK